MGYYILQNNETKGPYTLNQLKGMWSSGAVTGNLQYCEEGYTEWLPLSDLQPMLEPEQPRYSPQTQRLVQQATKSNPQNPSNQWTNGQKLLLIVFIIAVIAIILIAIASGGLLRSAV